MSQEQDKIFFRNFSLVVGGIAVMMIVFFIAAKIVNPGDTAADDKRAEKIAEITKPVGRVVVAGEEAAAEEEMVVAAADTAGAAAGRAKSGEEVFNGLCKNCHGMPAMAAMMPQIDDKAAWEPRIAKGIDTLYDHAINGFMGDMGMMPARGGNPALSDDEVKAAVDYMLEAVQ
ncbi:MAG: c-type cytochrome [Gammaproteobacteria bacterium]